MDSQIKPTEQADQRCDPDSDQRTFLTNEKKNGKGKASVGKKSRYAISTPTFLLFTKVKYLIFEFTLLFQRKHKSLSEKLPISEHIIFVKYVCLRLPSLRFIDNLRTYI